MSHDDDHNYGDEVSDSLVDTSLLSGLGVPGPLAAELAAQNVLDPSKDDYRDRDRKDWEDDSRY